jgi:type IV pilus assembly protein PilQ
MFSYTSIGRYVRSTLLMQCAALLVSASVLGGTVDIKKGPSLFSMEFRDAEIKDVLRAVGQAAHLNMIVGDGVGGKVSLSLKNVGILDALEAILKTHGLTYVRDANILRVVAFADVRPEDMETRIFPLGYANGKDTLGIVEKLKSEKARISSDTRMNAIVVKDLSLNLDKMERLLKNLDARTPQVLIEAKIVQVSSNYSRELGVQWGGRYNGNGRQITGGTTGINSSGTSGVTTIPTVGSSTLYPLTGDIGMSGNSYVVNLPAAVGTGAGGALGMTFGKIGGRGMLDLQLSAMQATGNGKVLSSPKIMTVNNKEAKISSGIDIPVRTVSSTAVGSTSSVQIISASLELSTTPMITNDNRIAMIVKVEKSEPDFTREVDGIPTIIKQAAHTDVVVNNGETIVLGGIYSKTEQNSEAGVPLLSKIPLIGWLFKKNSKFETQDELLIFITPTIVPAESSQADSK